jgi:hypothetical protein
MTTRRRNNTDGRFVDTHGQSRTPEYRAWMSMHDRCKRETHPAYANYGGRGITVCEEWSSFVPFFEEIGPRPGDTYSVDRIDNERGYEPGNVRWATKREQVLNRRSGAAKFSATMTGRPHYEKLKHVCECGLTTNAGPLARHRKATGHKVVGSFPATGSEV